MERTIPNRVYELSDTIPEEDKLKEAYLVGNINKHIAELFYEKVNERKAFDFYSQIRDATEFQWLTDNYGVSYPNKIPFVPIIANKIDALIGIALQNQFDYTITCNNREGIDLKLQQKKSEVLTHMISEAERIMKENVEMFKKGLSVETPAQQQGQKPTVETKDLLIERFIEKIKSKYNENWQADFEIAAQDFINYYIDAYELKVKHKEVAKNLFVSGQTFSRCYIRELGKDPVYEVVDVEDMFYDITLNREYLEDHRRVVCRRFMSSSEIFMNLGHLMTEDEKISLSTLIANYYGASFAQVQEQLFMINDNNQSIARTNNTRRYKDYLIEVFHVEWISPNKVTTTSADKKNLNIVEGDVGNEIGNERYRNDRYEGWKINIGHGAYIGCGKSRFVNRSINNPFNCKLSYNGVFYKNRNGKPFSLVLATKDLQDMFDITHFKLNNLMLSARAGGTITVVEHLLKEFGKTATERLLKSNAYEATLGTKIISLSQEGNEGQFAFNNYGNYPSNLDGQMLQAFIAYLDTLEGQAEKITGVNRQIMGQIEERDGKGTTMMAVTQGSLITKELFTLLSVFIKRNLTNLLNLSRITYATGFKGSYMLNGNNKIFEINGKTHSLVDYNIFVSDDKEDIDAKETSKEIVMQALGQQLIDLKSAFTLLLSKSTTEKKQAIETAINTQNSSATKQLADMQTEMQNLQKQLEEMQKENEKLKTVAGKADEVNMAFEKEKLVQQIAIEKEKNDIAREKMMREDQVEKLKVNAEIAQQYDNNKNNDKINYNR